MQDCSSFCAVASSELVFRRSHLGAPMTTKGQTAVNITGFPPKSVHSRRISNDSILSNDSGIGFTDADYEIQRAIRAQRVQRPRIIVLHRGKPIYQNHKDNDANLVLNAAVASRRHRREIAVMQQRNTIIFGEEKNDNDTSSFVESDNTIDVSSEDNSNNKIDISEGDGDTSEFELNSVVREEATRESVFLKRESIKTDSLVESKIDTILESNEQTPKNFVPKESIYTSRIQSIFTCDKSVTKKVTRSLKKLLGLEKGRRNCAVSFHKFLKKIL